MEINYCESWQQPTNNFDNTDMDDRKILITASQRSWGKEMFSQVSVNLLQEGWYLWNQVPSEGGYVQGGGHSPPWTWDLRKGGYSPTALPPRTWDTVGKWAARILLECFPITWNHFDVNPKWPTMSRYEKVKKVQYFISPTTIVSFKKWLKCKRGKFHSFVVCNKRL